MSLSREYEFVFNGEKWSLLEERILTHQYSWDTTVMKNGQHKLLVVVSDGILIGTDETSGFLIIKNLSDKGKVYILLFTILVVLIIVLISLYHIKKYRGLKIQ